jgi:hypothetical protein
MITHKTTITESATTKDPGNSPVYPRDWEVVYLVNGFTISTVLRDLTKSKIEQALEDSDNVVLVRPIIAAFYGLRIKEEIFSKRDMIDFAKMASKHVMQPVTGDELFDKWLKTRE